MNDSNPNDVTQDLQEKSRRQQGAAYVAHPQRIGRYRIAKVLGKGGFGIVYLAQDEQLNRPVAIKVPHLSLVSKPADAEMYLAEARMVANLDHPSIVPVYDVGSTGECPCFIVSKYVPGADLATKLKQQRLAYRAATELVATVADALHYAHKQGIVHRDVKPGNILINNEGQPYVVDFGLALRDENVGKGPGYAGTPTYMSPEQARGEGHRVDGRSDVFSLGVVFYELLTGRLPFRGDTNAELRERITSYEPRPLSQHDERIPKELQRICSKALSKLASQRYSSAHDLAADLRCFLVEPSVTPNGTSPIATLSTDMELLAPASASRSTAKPVDQLAPSGIPPIKIVPKSLRSFEAHDADFFLKLLPGPRDREGLPDSLRFWKTRIEQIDPDSTFSVGLIYGPSGCGKSSLVKAGLLPRLAAGVIPVYIEATPEETELRILNGIRKRCPSLTDNMSLKETLAAIRQGHGVPIGKKVLIVLDQFEQWLQANKEKENSDLLQAVRQCDGGRVQCIVMVRDDFWMAVSRFLRELEVRIVEGHNSASVDLFPVRHAERVLAEFGRAFGALPDNLSDSTKEQLSFLSQAVAGLADEGKVICVRLALFAEMMKGRAWTPTTLKEVGGTTGVGVTFLEESFSVSTSPPKHRYHQKAARAVLKVLLPDSCTYIKGIMRSRAELLDASGYANRPHDFDDLIGILDSEMRLITPTDPEGKEDEDESVSHTHAGQMYFQLTHDYLIQSLRDWLTRKQKETRIGRAELKLFDTSLTWNSKPENRFLPSLTEWITIRVLTDNKRWTEPQRRMMRYAAKAHALTWGATLAILLVVGLFLLYWDSQQTWKNKREQTRIAAESMQNNLGSSVPISIAELQKLPESLVYEQLSKRFATQNSRHKLAIAFALAAFDHVETEYLISRIDDLATTDTANFIDSLALDRDRALTLLRAEADKCSEQTLWRRKAKLAIAALALGESDIATDMCQYLDRRDPGQRTIFIHEFSHWEWQLPDRQINLQQLANAVAESKDAGLRSSLCMSVGRLPVDQLQELNPAGLESWYQLASRWFIEYPDTTTHGASSWLLRRWKRPTPELPDQHRISQDRDWFVNSAGMTMLRFRTPNVAPEQVITLANPLETYRNKLVDLPAMPRDHLSVSILTSTAQTNRQLVNFANALTDSECPEPNHDQAYLVPSLSHLRRTCVLVLSLFGQQNAALAAYEVAREALDKSIEFHLSVPSASLRGAAFERSNRSQFNAFALERSVNSLIANCFDNRRFNINANSKAVHVGPVSKSLVNMYLPQAPKLEAVPESEYWIASCEVTRGQFEAFMQDINYKFEKPTNWEGVDTAISPSDDHPAQQVSWSDAVMYCNWLSRREGMTAAYRKENSQLKSNNNIDQHDQWELIEDATGYRLPKEVEWENSIRAGSQTPWSSGDDEQLLADYCQMYPSKLAAVVGHKLPNAWGMLDMHGNVWEWCNDRFDGEDSFRVYRGGSWGIFAADCRSTVRRKYDPALRFHFIGFRLAFSSPGIQKGLETIK